MPETRVSRGATFTKYGDSWLCDEYQHDILVSPGLNDTWVVYVHLREDCPSGDLAGMIVAGPFDAHIFDVCVMWALHRAGDKQ